jgi:hypothetical protein
MIVAALRKYEREHPPAKGACYYYFIDQFAFNQHVFSKGSTQQETEDMMLSTLKESISVPSQMICLLHPWDEPVPFRRVWCLFELYTAMQLGAKVIMCFPPEDAEGFYSKLQNEETFGESTMLVPTIDASEAQASVESDRVRIFKEIRKSIGMEEFNAKLQEYLKRALQVTATEALLERGGVEGAGTGGSKATLSLLRAELEEAKRSLMVAQEETKTEVLQQMKQVVKKEEIEQLVKEEVKLLTAAQEETKEEMLVLATVQEQTKQEIGARMAVLEAKLDSVLSLLAGRVQ